MTAILCLACAEEVDADLPGWAQCDDGAICPGCNQAVQDVAQEYGRGSDGYERTGADMTPWQAFGDVRGKN